ncbi:hypothetical protein QJS10_CPB04g01550 [Acorus calamus]|uniref:CCHC-type domain-containing protein n=1 Tax=Acorus calamus TaxID=4465 RepID=A0AAV9F1J1_ACOCL|nr:hypothetical protein QJS10_CPB04g01550 [Acorus calamus]
MRGWTERNGWTERKRPTSRGVGGGSTWRGNAAPRVSYTRCFRCLQMGHWSKDCRDPVVCRQCRGLGHRAADCGARKGGSPNLVRGSRGIPLAAPTFNLSTGFTATAEAAFLRGSVIGIARGALPMLQEVKEAMEKEWGRDPAVRIRNLGAGYFTISDFESGRREWMLKEGSLRLSRGSLEIRPWTPAFAARPVRTRAWRVRFLGLPLHWIDAGCVVEMAAKFGKLVDISYSGMSCDGKSMKEVTLEADEGVTFPSTMILSDGMEKYHVGVEAVEMRNGPKRTWAEVVGDARAEMTGSTKGSPELKVARWVPVPSRTQGMASDVRSVSETVEYGVKAIMQVGPPGDSDQQIKLPQGVGSVTSSPSGTVNGVVPAQSNDGKPDVQLASKGMELARGSPEGCLSLKKHSGIGAKVKEDGRMPRDEVFMDVGTRGSGGRTPGGSTYKGVVPRPAPEGVLFPFGPGSVGPGWAWAWVGNDLKSGGDLYMPIRSPSPNFVTGSTSHGPIDQRSPERVMISEEVLQGETPSRTGKARQREIVLTHKEEHTCARGQSVGLLVGQGTDKGSFLGGVAAEFGKQGPFEENEIKEVSGATRLVADVQEMVSVQEESSQQDVGGNVVLHV